MFAVQEFLTRWLVRELNGFDNLFYEIQNEPWADNHMSGEVINPYLLDRQTWPNAVEIPTAETVAWQRAIARVITDEESRLPNRHLIAQNVANFRLALNDGDLVPEASIVNFHYAYPEAAEWNRGLNRVIGCDETGFAGKDDAHYRRQAWRFMLSGGALFNNLDYSFTVGHEDGCDAVNQAPGGGSPALRQQLKVLSDFLHRFDLARLHPDPLLVVRRPGVVAHVLSQPGKAHAIYVQGRSPTTLVLNLAAGSWTAEWVFRRRRSRAPTQDGRGQGRRDVRARSAPVSQTPWPSASFSTDDPLFESEPGLSEDDDHEETCQSTEHLPKNHMWPDVDHDGPVAVWLCPCFGTGNRGRHCTAACPRGGRTTFFRDRGWQAVLLAGRHRLATPSRPGRGRDAALFAAFD